jgi:hypothetical protein
MIYVTILSGVTVNEGRGQLIIDVVRRAFARLTGLFGLYQGHLLRQPLKNLHRFLAKK